jgi:hypothetical protein
LLAYCIVAGALGVNLVFAAFLAGFAVVHKKRRLFAAALDAIGKVSSAFFIPVYFAIVGLKLDVVKAFSWRTLFLFLVGTCVIKLLSVALAGRLAGFRGLDLINLAITTNARGGPGIVLASVAFDAGIINAKFYTTLVLAAVITSQFAGAWLEYVLRRGWPLLRSDKIESDVVAQGGDVTGDVNCGVIETPFGTTPRNQVLQREQGGEVLQSTVQVLQGFTLGDQSATNCKQVGCGAITCGLNEAAGQIAICTIALDHAAHRSL